MGTPIHGKDAMIYLGDGAGTAAALVSELNTYTIEHDFDLAEVSDLQDTWKSNVKGMQAWTGSIDGNFDTANQQLWSAATGSQTSNFYLYPQGSSGGRYYYGTCWVKLPTTLGGGTGDKAKVSVSLIGDGALTAVG